MTEADKKYRIERYTIGAKHRTLQALKQYPSKEDAFLEWSKITKAERGTYPYLYQYELLSEENYLEYLIDYISSNYLHAFS